jgi:glucose/arabinose dehydrogenase
MPTVCPTPLLKLPSMCIIASVFMSSRYVKPTVKSPFVSFSLCAFVLSIFLSVSACGSATPQGAFQATLPPTVSSAPVYTATPTLTPSLTPTVTPTLTATLTLTPSPTLTVTPSQTPSLTPSLPPSPTLPLLTLTPATSDGAPNAILAQAADFSAVSGWSCEDFPCEDDIAGFLERIRVPPGFIVEHVGKFPGQPLQITYGPDGRLYGTILENGSRNGAVYALNGDGTSQRYSGDLIAPVGLAFQPGTDVLYVSARVTEAQGGGLYRVLSNGTTETIIDDLPCCYSLVDNQPNGLTFGADGYLYMGIGSLTDHAESPNPESQPYAEVQTKEAAILRIQPHTGAVEVYAQGLHNPYDVTFDTQGQAYGTDSGILEGPGDRALTINEGSFYGWPYWRTRGCTDCPLSRADLTVEPDLVTFPDFSLPRGLVAYNGIQFPANYFGSLFIALWNGTPDAQRIVRIDLRDPRLGGENYTPEPFMTGLIRPVDVIVAPDGSLVVADFIYGHVWRVKYTG